MNRRKFTAVSAVSLPALLIPFNITSAAIFNPKHSSDLPPAIQSHLEDFKTEVSTSIKDLMAKRPSVQSCFLPKRILEQQFQDSDNYVFSFVNQQGTIVKLSRTNGTGRVWVDHQV